MTLRRLIPFVALACRPTATTPPAEPAPAPAAGVLGTVEEPSGSLEKNDIRNIVRGHIGEIRACYERGLARDPSLTGRVEIQFVIGQGGGVTDVTVASSTLPPASKAVADCIAAAVLGWQFPDPGGKVMITYPFVLEPTEPVQSASGLVAGTQNVASWFFVAGYPPRTAVVEVVDAAGASAIGVPVTLKIYSGTDERARTVATDARGRAVFPDLPAGAAIDAVIEADAAHPKVASSSTVLGAAAIGTILLRRNNSPAD
jgi:hypothetical protein